MTALPRPRMQGAGSAGGVAFWAHIGGFLAGLAQLTLVFGGF